PHRLHLRGARGGARPDRRARRDRALLRAPLFRHPDRGQGAGHVRPSPRGRDRVVARAPGGREPRRRDGSPSGDGRPTPADVVRGLFARRLARGDRHPREHRTRGVRVRGGERNVERETAEGHGEARRHGQEERIAVKVTIAGGGTAGHVFPALAVGRELAERGVDVDFVGTAAGPEGRFVRDAGFPFREAEAVAVAGRGPLHKAAVPWRLYRAINSCLPLVESSDVVVGMGGYVSVPAVAAAVRLRRPVVLHEQNSVPGLANRWLARPARVVAVSFAETARSFPRRVRTEVTGNPVREEIAAVRDQRAILAKEALRELDLEEGRRTLL